MTLTVHGRQFLSQVHDWYAWFFLRHRYRHELSFLEKDLMWLFHCKVLSMAFRVCLNLHISKPPYFWNKIITPLPWNSNYRSVTLSWCKLCTHCTVMNKGLLYRITRTHLSLSLFQATHTVYPSTPAKLQKPKLAATHRRLSISSLTSFKLCQ